MLAASGAGTASAVATDPPSRGGSPTLSADDLTHVFFDWNSAKISAESAKTLDAMAVQAASGEPRSLLLLAYSDRSGSRGASHVMARRRAAAVKAYLVEKGASAAIATRAFGATHLLIPTAAGVREAQNRRVDIRTATAPTP